MKKLLCILSLFFLISCKKDSSKNQFAKLEKMNWLIGNWEQTLPDGILIETWTKQNDSTFSGNSYFINTKDTVHFESIKIVQTAQDLKYIATVVGQNNEKPVAFKLTSDIDNAFTFENFAHDYPRKISYKKVSNTRLIASISGMQQGKDSTETYSMIKK